LLGWTGVSDHHVLICTSRDIWEETFLSEIKDLRPTAEKIKAYAEYFNRASIPYSHGSKSSKWETVSYEGKQEIKQNCNVVATFHFLNWLFKDAVNIETIRYLMNNGLVGIWKEAVVV
jgi:hypothetical protein